MVYFRTSGGTFIFSGLNEANSLAYRDLWYLDDTIGEFLYVSSLREPMPTHAGILEVASSSPCTGSPRESLFQISLIFYLCMHRYPVIKV
jgi:hypothetical protein